MKRQALSLLVGALMCILGVVSGDGGRRGVAAEASQRGLEESLASVSQAYVGGKRVYYMQPPSLQPAATARKAAQPASGVTSRPMSRVSSSEDAAEEARINTLPSRPALRPVRVVQHHLKQPVTHAPSVAAAAPVQRAATVSTPVAAAPAVPALAAAPQQALSSRQETELAKINRLRAQARHEWSRARALGHKQLLAEGGDDGKPKAGLAQLVCFALVSVAGTLLVFVRVGMPIAFT
mmetsp:Transcript_1993/g.4501  ORF Transcript_1993/g.4501 Transcript_1993/m.4501 type:complete len:237 (+) Transcript_1993:3-713(+)